jgi:poly-gamma-glutamate capsule biosynthesis protein CapA/YwtB (metallophosphatase superfamily)
VPATSPEPSSAVPETQPLALVTHHVRPRYAVSERQARRIAAGAVTRWSALGPPRGAGRPGKGRLRVVAIRGSLAADRLEAGGPQAVVRRVSRDPDTVGLLPVTALRPGLRAVRVAGVDPVRRPQDYPLRVPGRGLRGQVVTLSVAGDVMLARGVAEAAAARPGDDPAPALGPMTGRLTRADLVVANLESTLSRAGAPTQGGDSFAADPRVASRLADAGFDALSLANNHAGDFGDRALLQTVRRLRSAGLRTFGAGATPAEAWRPAVLERRGVRFGFLGFNAIGETPAVGPGQPGAVSVSMPPRTGPLDRGELRRFLAAVRRLARRVDVVVVMPHWGTQYTNRPEPVQRRVARRLARVGADLVVGGHPHWVQGVQRVDGALVVHSLGNFVFDMDFMAETMAGVLLEATFRGDRLVAVDFVPYRMDPSFTPRVVRGDAALEVLGLLWQTSGPAFGGRPGSG